MTGALKVDISVIHRHNSSHCRVIVCCFIAAHTKSHSENLSTVSFRPIYVIKAKASYYVGYYLLQVLLIIATL